MGKIEDRARRLSNAYYNQALDCAGIRDLTGAEEKLRLSLQMDKTNLTARNLLGLVYYEQGEVVAALREWVISNNMNKVDNPAIHFITAIRKDPKRLQQMNQTIHQYNEALRCAKEGNEDIAAIRLRKIIKNNPKHVKAYQLLALIDIKQKHYTHAGRLLKKACEIDAVNPETLRLLKEIDDVQAGLFERNAKKNGEKDKKKLFRRRSEDLSILDAAPVRRKSKVDLYRERPGYSSLMNVLFGIVIGLMAVVFMVRPAVSASVNRDANAKIVEYTTTMATQENKINELQNKINDSENTVKDAQTQLESSKNATDSYDNLIRAYLDYQAGNYEQAGDEILKVDVSVLSTEACEIYDANKDAILSNAYDAYEFGGDNAFYLKDWTKAASYFEKALSIKEGVYDVMNLLAQAYQNDNRKQKAIDAYQKIIDTFPNTRRAEYAAAAITELGGTPENMDGSAGTAAPESTEENTDTGATQTGTEDAGYTDTDVDTTTVDNTIVYYDENGIGYNAAGEVVG
ncbi:MAG: tetratricopeptide repeat protein [Eubacterium sp.]|nr:tetratricopeptide repeat protein [Eubacterium sp.]